MPANDSPAAGAGPADPLAPLFVLSPAARCGITLIQRLLNSTRKMIVYGENSLLASVLPGYLMGLAGQEAELNAARRRLLGGDYDFWSSSVWPPTDRIRGAVIESLRQVLAVYQDCARADGFARWGVKTPIVDGRYLRLYYDLCPEGRFVFVYRHVADVIASQKARKWLDSLEKVAAETQRWCRVMHYMRGASGDGRLLIVRYEQMTADGEAFAAELERFAGVEGIDRAVFGRKLNTFVGPAEAGMSRDQYVAPAELTGAELEVIHRLASPMLAELGYQPLTQWRDERRAGQAGPRLVEAGQAGLDRLDRI